MSLINMTIGPQHPMLKEPIKFDFQLEGEKIVSVDAHIGYAHRGIEKGMENSTYVQGLMLVERICGICSHAHSMAFIQAVEELMELQVPERAHYIRCLVGELERLHSHLLWVGVLAHEVGFDTIFMYSWKDREVVMDILEKLSGNRVNYALNIFGGVKRDIDPEQLQDIRAKVKKLRERIKYYVNIGEHEPSFVARMKNVGILPRDQATILGAVGPTARASGVPVDHRKHDTFGIYHKLSVNVCTATTGDALARYDVRVRELLEACDLIEQIIAGMPEGETRVRFPRKVKAGEVLSRYEAPRGEDVHYLRANGTDKPDRYKVRAPTLANIPAVLYMLQGAFVADIPVIVASIDPCVSCTDRMAVATDRQSGSVWSWKQLREYGIQWYARERSEMPNRS